MIDQVKTMLIGLFVVIACGLIVGIVLFIEPSVGDGQQLLYVRFSNINGINVGTRVLFAGKAVGEVTKIETIPNARKQPIDELGNVYFYQLTLHVDSNINVYTTDEVTIQTSGLLGERSVAIVPKVPPKGVVPQLVNAKMPIYASSVDPIQGAFNQLSSLGEKMEETFDRVNEWIDDNGNAVGSAVRSFDSAMGEFSDALATVNDTHVIEDAKATINSFGTLAQDIDQVVCDLRDNGTIANFSATMENAKHISESIQTISKTVASGQGTIGRLLMSDDLYLEANAVFSKVDTMMNDINHYGFLFNLNKEWQRNRLKRVTLLNALKTPDEFRDYFEKELDTINTAMSRLSMLIDRADNSQEREAILRNRTFRSDFASLLRQVNLLLDHLKLYNEQLEEVTQDACP